MKPKLEFIRVDHCTNSQTTKIWFRNIYGQVRFMELQGRWFVPTAQEFLREIERLFLSHVIEYPTGITQNIEEPK